MCKTFFGGIPAFAEKNYEIELAPMFKNYYKILHDNENKDEFKKNCNTHLAIDMLSDVIHKAPGTLTTFEMISLLKVVKFWENDKILKEKYLKMKEKYLNNLNSTEDDTADKLLLIILIRSADYAYTLNEREEEENYKKCVEGLIKMKVECTNRDYRALALYCLLSVSRTYNDEILANFSDHPLIFIGEQNAISYKYLNDKYESIGDHLTKLDELKTLYKKYENLVIPGGYEMEVKLYSVFATTYAYNFKDYETAQKYLKQIEEKAPDYYKLQSIKNIVESAKN